MTSTMSEVDAFFSSGGAPAPERENGRYKLPDPHTGEQRSYQSASNYGYPLLDQYGLTKWRQRQLLIGVAQRPDLIAMLSTMGTAAGEDNSKLDEIVATALNVAGTSVKANRGTAIHEAFRAADEGRPYPAEYEPFVASYRAELARHGLTVGLIERLVTSPGFGACGRLDRTFIEADGTHVLGDVKSTGRLELQAHEISVQLKIYQAASHMRSADGKTWEAIPRGKHPLRDDYAIVVHVDQETAAVTLYRVDLRIGGIGAQLAEQVRGWRKSGPVLLPYVPPAGNVAEAEYSTAQVVTATAEQVAELQASNPSMEHPVVFNGPEIVTVPGLGPVELTPDPWAGPAVIGPPVAMAPTEHGGVIHPTPGMPEHDYRGGMDTPPDVIGVAVEHINRVHGVNVAYNRDPAIPGGEVQPVPPVAQGGQYPETSGAGVPVPQPTPSVSQYTEAMYPPHPNAPVTVTPLLTAAEMMKPTFTKAKVQQYCRDHGITEDLAHTKAKLIEKLNAKGKLAHPGMGGQMRAEPHIHPAQTEAFRSMTLSKIGNASSAGELQTINREVVRFGGDQAWTDEMTEAARVRVGQLDAVTPAVPHPETILFDKIRVAENSSKLAEIWEEVTVGGSVPGNWTPAIHQASTARLAELNTARPPAPANPFGP